MKQRQDAQNIWLFKSIKKHVVGVWNYSLIDSMLLDKTRSLGIGAQESKNMVEDAIFHPARNINGAFVGDIAYGAPRECFIPLSCNQSANSPET